MRHLSIDIETYSDVDIGKCGMYRYAESDAFEVLLFAYSADGGPVCVIDIINGERIPDEIMSALFDPMRTMQRLSGTAYQSGCRYRIRHRG